MKNLLIIIPHLSSGGAEKCAANLSDLLKEKYKVYIVTFFSEKQFKTSYAYHGELHSIGQKSSTSKFQKISNTIQRITFLRKFKKQYNIDYTISYLFNAHIANVISKRKDKVILALSTYLSANEILIKRKKWITKYYRKADKLVALNKRGMNDVVDNFGVYPQLLTVIPNFYDAKDIQKNAKEPVPEWENTAAYTKFLQVGRFTYAKGQWHLLRIFKETLKHTPNARLFIIGAGEMQEFLTDYAAELGLKLQDLTKTEDKTPDLKNHNLIFMGFLSNPFKYLRQSDLFLFTSLYEGFPNALSEAMICGCKVFSTDCTTGPRELIAPEQKAIQNYPFHTDYGVLFPAFNGEKINVNHPILPEEQCWIDTLKRYADKPEIYDQMGENAEKRMRKYDKNEVKRMWIELIDKV